MSLDYWTRICYWLLSDAAVHSRISTAGHSSPCFSLAVTTDYDSSPPAYIDKSFFLAPFLG